MNYCDIPLWYGAPHPRSYTMWSGLHWYCNANYSSACSTAPTQVFNPSLHQTQGRKFPRYPTLVLERRPVILGSGSYNFIRPRGPSSHQSNTDMVNWCRGDFKCAAVSSLSFGLFEFGGLASPLRGKQSDMHVVWMLLRVFHSSIELRPVYFMEVMQSLSLLSMRTILFFMIKATAFFYNILNYGA